MNPILIVKSRKPAIILKAGLEKLFYPRLRQFDAIKGLFSQKVGIEIGGPSLFFSSKGFLPIYDVAQKVDGCNFSSETVWEGSITQGNNYAYATGKTGYQFICDGVDVPVIPVNTYDFVLSCNNLEHIANPLKAISNWLKLLKEQGSIVLVLPKKESNFDHKRPITKIEHLLNDYNKNIAEDDLTHLPEILQLHDLRLDPLAGGFKNFKKRSEDNFSNRCLHHHVFDLNLLQEICDYFKLTVLIKTNRVTDHLIIARK